MEEFKIISSMAKVCKIRDHTGNVLQLKSLIKTFTNYIWLRTYGNPAAEQVKKFSMTKTS